MKKFLFLTAALMLTCFGYSQQTNSGIAVQKNDQVQTNFDRMSEELGLSDAQKTEIMAINKKYKEKKEAIRATGTSEDFKALEVAKHNEVKAVLTPEQNEKMKRDRIQAEKDGKRKEFQKATK